MNECKHRICSSCIQKKIIGRTLSVIVSEGSFYSLICH
ncbi:MAG: hypothetical protein ACI4KB_11105 [Oscillospiraceae bacterium]